MCRKPHRPYLDCHIICEQHMITLTDLTLGYEGHPAVHHLSGTFAKGSMTAIIGPNGSGKSTLLKAMAGALKPMHGHLTANRADIAYLPQANSIESDFPATVEDLVSLGLWRSRRWFKSLTHADSHTIHHALEAVGLAGFAARPVATLSGGQLQRALFARLKLQDCPVILLDEPFTAIDTRTVDDIMVLLHRWHDEGRTIIAVLHDLEFVKKHFPQSLLLAREKIAWGETADVTNATHIQKARTMQEAWDDTAPWCHEDAA
jgi:zinc/manganese transport system ATP-binding protein